MGIFDRKNESPIRRVKLMGMRTAQETLIFTTVNFTVYSFWVEYENGKTETLEISPKNPNDKSGKEKKLFNKLMAYANSESEEVTGGEVSPNDSSSILDELQKIKELLDAGVLPQDLYEKKRIALLERLSSTDSLKSSSSSKNVVITRTNKRPWGESDTSLYVDGKEYVKDIDDSAPFFLPTGEHIVYFQRATVKSKKVAITISAAKQYQINVTPKTFSIDVNIEER